MMTDLKEMVTGGESSQRDVEDAFLQHISRDIVWDTVVCGFTFSRVFLTSVVVIVSIWSCGEL